MLESGNHQNEGSDSLQPSSRKRSRFSAKVNGHKSYSPKKVANAIGVSESSLKRWCDAGFIKAVKTAGGHRRVTRSEIISFVKRKNYSLRDPVAIGLPDIRDVHFAGIDQARVNFQAAMVHADKGKSEKILCALFIRGHNVAEIFDRVISPAFTEIGKMWESGQLDVYQERMATQICYQSLLQMRTMIPEPGSTAPVAIGASFENNQYQLATLGVELCLKNSGWQATSLGANIPLNSLLQAANDMQPSFIWISATALIPDPASFISKINAFSESVTAATKVVIGGQAVNDAIRNGLKSVHYCESFAQLVLLARVPNSGLLRRTCK